jgi:hypothetical protein
MSYKAEAGVMDVPHKSLTDNGPFLTAYLPRSIPAIHSAFACQNTKHLFTLSIQYLSFKTLSIGNCYEG